VNRSISPAVAERAVQWLVELQSPQVTDQTRAQWRDWLIADPSHQQAWQRIETFSQRLEGLHAGPQNTLMYATLTPGVSRRRALKSLAVLVAAGGVAWSARDNPWVQPWRGDYRSGVGEQRRITLTDGSELQLNTDTSVDVRFDPQTRLITLYAGEILVRCAPDSTNRPFTVQTAQGRCTASAAGSRFSVRQSAGVTLGSTWQKALQITPRAGTTSTLAQGQSVWFDQFAVLGTGVALAGDLAWTQGMVVADNQRLGEFLDNLARYRQGHLGCDPEVAGLKISGTYPLADTDRVLASVSQTLHLDVRRFTRFWTTLGARVRTDNASA
jgi:transmembrane sensor